MEDELSQWCEIDGHEWVTTYFIYGLVLGPSAVDINMICSKCKQTEFRRFVPREDDYRVIRYGDII